MSADVLAKEVCSVMKRLRRFFRWIRVSDVVAVAFTWMGAGAAWTGEWGLCALFLAAGAVSLWAGGL